MSDSTQIKWIDPKNRLPQIDKTDDYNREHKISPRLLVWVIDREGNDRGVSFATYNHDIDHWNISDFKGSFKVKGYVYINPPKF